MTLTWLAAVYGVVFVGALVWWVFDLQRRVIALERERKHPITEPPQ